MASIQITNKSRFRNIEEVYTEDLIASETHRGLELFGTVGVLLDTGDWQEVTGQHRADDFEHYGFRLIAD